MFSGPLAVPKAYPFPSPVFLDEINASGLERSADGRLICGSHRYLSFHNFGSSDRCHAHF
jgi:hypothetical protein